MKEWVIAIIDTITAGDVITIGFACFGSLGSLFGWFKSYENREQAKKSEEQAKKSEEQAKKSEEQTKIYAENADRANIAVRDYCEVIVNEKKEEAFQKTVDSAIKTLRKNMRIDRWYSLQELIELTQMDKKIIDEAFLKDKSYLKFIQDQGYMKKSWQC